MPGISALSQKGIDRPVLASSAFVQILIANPGDRKPPPPSLTAEGAVVCTSSALTAMFGGLVSASRTRAVPCSVGMVW